MRDNATCTCNRCTWRSSAILRGKIRSFRGGDTVLREKSSETIASTKRKVRRTRWKTRSRRNVTGPSRVVLYFYFEKHTTDGHPFPAGGIAVQINPATLSWFNLLPSRLSWGRNTRVASLTRCLEKRRRERFVHALVVCHWPVYNSNELHRCWNFLAPASKRICFRSTEQWDSSVT